MKFKIEKKIHPMSPEPDFFELTVDEDDDPETVSSFVGPYPTVEDAEAAALALDAGAEIEKPVEA